MLGRDAGDWPFAAEKRRLATLSSGLIKLKSRYSCLALVTEGSYCGLTYYTTGAHMNALTGVTILLSSSQELALYSTFLKMSSGLSNLIGRQISGSFNSESYLPRWKKSHNADSGLLME